MRIWSIVLITMALSCVNVSCDSVVGSADNSAIVGGFSEPRRLSDEEALLFESVASKVAGVNYTPMNVATQIVAGTNYRFLCKGKDVERGGKKFYAVIVVHKPLPNQGEPRILSIERQAR